MLVTAIVILLFALLLIRVPVGFAIGIAGVVGLYLHGGTDLLLGLVSVSSHTAVSAYTLSAIPLFILMAQFVLKSGVAGDLFATARAWTGGVRGGLGVATAGAGALFAAISGSSTAAAATLATTSTAEMTAAGYNKRLANGLAAVVGTLAAMIPPSIILVFYAVLAEESVGKILVAGVVPGIAVTLAIIVTLQIQIRLRPDLAPRDQARPWSEKLRTLAPASPVLLLFALVTGTIYFGLATPTEAAAFGGIGALAIMLARRTATLRALYESAREAVDSTVMILMIIFGAHVFGYFLAATQVTPAIAAWVGGLPIPPMAVFAVIGLIYLVLGFFMDQMAILALTVPVVLPVVSELGLDPIWFGVMVVLLAEIGLVSPPLGLNVFVVARASRQRVEEVFWGAAPFAVSILVVVVLFSIFPEAVLWLPNSMTAE
ncbi:TRAP transporter large permease [Nocardiopsis coralliicola]